MSPPLEEQQVGEYRELVGCLNYLAVCTRPDIAQRWSVTALARYYLNAGSPVQRASSHGSERSSLTMCPSTNQMVADSLTKALRPALFVACRDGMDVK